MKRTRSYNYKEQKPKTQLGKKTNQNDVALCKSDSGGRTSRNVTSMRVETETQRTGGMEINADALGHMVASIIRKISKEAGGLALVGSSRSLVDDLINNGQMAQKRVDMDLEENKRKLHEDAEYEQQELDAALAVIKKTMELDAADPFNRPVDPIALEIPDYFDVIKTPMDFGTICNNLENGLKYMNSTDVFKDVQYIWHNCLIYNKKGDHILKLMMRVKTFFMKHWKAARLHMEQSPTIIDVQPLSESSILRHSKQQKENPLANNLTQLHETEVGQSQQSSSRQQSSPEKDEPNIDVQPLSESSILRHSKQQKENPLANNLTQLQETEVGQSQQSSSRQQSSPEKDEPNIDSSNTQKKRQIYGLTHHQKLLLKAGRIKISTNELGQPVGPDATQLTSFLGHTARDGNLAPLTYSGWSKMPQKNKENMWQKVLTRFDIEPACRKWVLLSLGSKWRNFKAHLKALHYDTHATDKERLADRDERVLPDQWSFLVSQWSSDEFQKLSARNKANRAKVKFIHTAGTKSFARVLEEEREKRPDGQEPSQAELFILTRTRKNGQPVNETTAAVISKLLESGTQDDAYHRLIGADRKGGVSLPELNATNATMIPSHAEALKMVEEKNAEVVEMRERLASVEETCSHMAAQMSAMVSMMANIQKGFLGGNIPNDVPQTSVPVGILNQSETAFTSNHEVPAKQNRGRKKRR